MSFSFDDIDVSKKWSDKRLQLYYLVRDWISGDILTGDDEENIYYIFRILPEDLHPDDGLVFLKILREIGLPDFGWIRSWIRLDDCSGRIEALSLGLKHGLDYDDVDAEDLLHPVAVPNRPAFDLPPAVASLSHLKVLNLTNCKSIPEDIKNLRLLEEISLRLCPHDLMDGISPVRLESVKRFTIVGPDEGQLPFLPSQHLAHPPHFAWRLFELPSLECLCFRHLRHHCSDQVLQALKSIDCECAFFQSLKILEFSNCQLHETSRSCDEFPQMKAKNQFGELLLDIIPRFPNVQELNLPRNYFIDLQPTAERIAKERALGLASKYLNINISLCTLDLYSHYTAKARAVTTMATKTSFCRLVTQEELESVIKWKKENIEKDLPSILTILDAFQGITSLSQMTPPLVYEPQVEHRLRINHAGRKHMCSDINVALWPRILNRAYKDSPGGCGAFFRKDETTMEYSFVKAYKCATGVFHLLRHGSLFTSGHFMNGKRCPGRKRKVSHI